jgi:uncharacterized protein
MQHIFLYLFLILLTSCNFNGMFLQPIKVPAEAKKLLMKTATDTVTVHFQPGNYQPTFIKNGSDTMQFDFEIESVVFASSNGNRLNGWMLKPKDSNPAITLLHLHGNAGFLLSQYGSVSPLVKYGFQIFVFDYSGFGFSEGEATRSNVLADASSALNYLKSRSDVKRTKIVIYGHSLGGHLSAVVAEQRQDDIDGLVIEGAFSSHRDIAAKTAGIFGRMIVKESYSACESIRKYKKPLLVIHSSEDDVVPFEMGQKIFKNANEPKEFFEIKHCHICGPEFYSEIIAHKIVTMLENHEL